MRRKFNGAQVCHRSYGFREFFGTHGVVGERCLRSEAKPKGLWSSGPLIRGVQTSETAGMSSDNRREKRRRRKPKVSYAQCTSEQG